MGTKHELLTKATSGASPLYPGSHEELELFKQLTHSQVLYIRSKQLETQQQKLDTAKQQKEIVLMEFGRMAEKFHNEHAIEALLHLSRTGASVSQEDERGLREAFKEILIEELARITSDAVASEPEYEVGEEYGEQAEGEEEEEEEEDLEFTRVASIDFFLSIVQEQRGELQEGQAATHWASGQPGEQRHTLKFRTNDGLTFGDLKVQVCRYLGLNEKRKESLELYCMASMEAWDESMEVSGELDKLKRRANDTNESMKYIDLDLPIIFLRRCTAEVVEEEADESQQRPSVAEALEKKAQQALADKKARCARLHLLREERLKEQRTERLRRSSMLFRGLGHLVLAGIWGSMLLVQSNTNGISSGFLMTTGVISALNTGFSYNRVTQTARTSSNKCDEDIVRRQALAPVSEGGLGFVASSSLEKSLPDLAHTVQYDTSNPTLLWCRSLSSALGLECTDRFDTQSLYRSDSENVELHTIGRLHAMNDRTKIDTLQELEGWLRNVFVPTVAPRCDYAGREILYMDSLPGSIGSEGMATNVLISSLRFFQTRWQPDLTCTQPGFPTRIENSILRERYGKYATTGARQGASMNQTVFQELNDRINANSEEYNAWVGNRTSITRAHADIHHLNSTSLTPRQTRIFLQSRTVAACYQPYHATSYFGPNGTDVPGFSYTTIPSPPSNQSNASFTVALRLALVLQMTAAAAEAAAAAAESTAAAVRAAAGAVFKPYSSPVCLGPRLDTTPGGGGCFGPSGYIRDVYAARDYRATIEELLNYEWIDDHTYVMAIRMQVVNPQIGCLIAADISFVQSGGGTVKSDLKMGIACVESHDIQSTTDLDSLWSGEFLPLSSIGSWTAFTYFAAFCYGLLLVRRQVKMVMKSRSASKVKTQEAGGHEATQDEPLTMLAAFIKFLNGPYVLDTLCLVLLFTLFVLRLRYAAVTHALMTEQLQHRRTALESIGKLAEVTDVWDQVQALSNVTLREASLRSLKSSAGLGGVWIPSDALVSEKINATLLFDQEIPFVDMHPITALYEDITGVSSFILPLLVLKFFRYFQFQKPLQMRYNKYGRTLISVLIYVVFIVHFMLAFVFLGQIIFGPHLDAFASATQCFISLATLLVGNALTGAQLINLAHGMDAQMKIMAYTFIFLFIVLLCITAMSMLISVFNEAHGDSTVVIMREQQRRTKDAAKALEEKEILEQDGIEKGSGRQRPWPWEWSKKPDRTSLMDEDESDGRATVGFSLSTAPAPSFDAESAGREAKTTSKPEHEPEVEDEFASTEQVGAALRPALPLRSKRVTWTQVGGGATARQLTGETVVLTSATAPGRAEESSRSIRELSRRERLPEAGNGAGVGGQDAVAKGFQKTQSVPRQMLWLANLIGDGEDTMAAAIMQKTETQRKSVARSSHAVRHNVSTPRGPHRGLTRTEV
jgi:hypothetical protein